MQRETHKTGDLRQLVEAQGHIDLEADRHEEHSKEQCAEWCDVRLHLTKKKHPRTHRETARPKESRNGFSRVFYTARSDKHCWLADASPPPPVHDASGIVRWKKMLACHDKPRPKNSLYQGLTKSCRLCVAVMFHLVKHTNPSSTHAGSPTTTTAIQADAKQTPPPPRPPLR